MARTKENEAEWQKHRDELEFLWLKQRWTAERIRDYMSQKHDFHRSKYQYGRQFRQWGFKKNSSDERWKFIAHRREKRKRDGKDPGPVSLDGRLVPESKVRKETSRHVTLTSQYMGIEGSDPKTPEGVIVGTPPSGITGAVSNDFSDVIAVDRCQDLSMDIPNLDASTLFQPAVGDSPAFQFELPGRNLPGIEANFMRDFSCCGVSLPSLHNLLQHYEEAHAQKSPQPGGQRPSHNGHRAAIGALLPSSESPAAPSVDLGHTTLEHCVPELASAGTPTSADGNSHIQHISSAMSEEIAEDIRRSLRQLRGLRVDCDSDLVMALEPITIGGANSDMTKRAQAIFRPSSPDNLLHYLNLCIYLSSNNMMSLQATEDLVSVIAKSRSQPRLRALLVSTTTTIEIFMSNLLVGAAAEGDVEICRILIEAGADLDAPSGLGMRTTALHRALLFSKLEFVRMLLKAGADPNLTMYGETPLHIACSTRGSLDAVRLLLQFGAHVNPAQGPATLTPLQLAVKAGKPDLVQLLLDSKANPRFFTINSQGWALLYRIALSYRENVKIVELLIAAGADIPLRKGANVNTPPSGMEGKTALQTAAAAGNIEGARILLDANAAVNIDPVLTEGVTALDEAIQISDSVIRHEIVSLLPRAGAYTGTHQIQKQYACLHDAERSRKLEAAASSCDQEILQLFLDKEPDIISSDPIAKSRVIMLALERRNCDVPFLELLLKAGAAVERIPPSPWERSVLQVAVEKCKYNYGVVKWLLSAGATVNHRWETDKPLSVTALQAAVEKCNSSLDKENIDVVRLLLENGADINAPAAENGGKTALQMAVSEGNLAMTEFLVHHGADVNGSPSPHQGRTALQEAASSGFVQLTEFLLAHGADVNAPAAPFGGVTALQGAAIEGNVRIVMMLLQAGADINGAPAIDQGRNAIEGAAENGRLNTLHLLLDYHPNIEEFEVKKKRAAELALANGHGHLAIGRFLLAYRKHG
ncbi:hypothetical protein DTO217A2_4523 [Paecilomyces variotii]|nr:hypothetical protein DTO217A2_4523 [Paecilomyces variotii]